MFAGTYSEIPRKTQDEAISREFSPVQRRGGPEDDRDLCVLITATGIILIGRTHPSPRAGCFSRRANRGNLFVQLLI